MRSRNLAPLAFVVASGCCPETVLAQTQANQFDFSVSARWKKFRHDTFVGPGPYLGAAIGGAFELAGNSPKEWGQTGKGYTRYAGDVFGRNFTAAAITQSGQALLGLDPSYRRCACTGTLRRIANAFAGSVTAFDRSGKRRFDPMPLLGAYGSGLVAASWYPSAYNPLVKGVQLGHQQFAGVPLANLFTEFAPELKRLNPLKRRRPGCQIPQPAGASPQSS